ncbi:MAG: toxic anion resistance protein [Proteobacteria bacterium]|nr:toxic anion resistance protein [Pseudomonadota bacterium]
MRIQDKQLTLKVVETQPREIKPERKADLDAQAQLLLVKLTRAIEEGNDIQDTVASIEKIGRNEIKKAGAVSARLLHRQMHSRSARLFDNDSTISGALTAFREKVESLDPSHHIHLFAPKKLFGFFQFKNNAKDYFAKYRSSQNELNMIICTLQDGKDELLKENATIFEEKLDLSEVIQLLYKSIYLTKQFTQKVSTVLNKIKESNPGAAQSLDKDLASCLTQRAQDVSMQLAVSKQGYQAMTMTYRNNLDLIKAIDKSINTTLSALQTAIVAAQIVANEKLVLDKISLLNTTTDKAIEKTAYLFTSRIPMSKQGNINKKIELQKIKEHLYAIRSSLEELDRVRVRTARQDLQPVREISSATGFAIRDKYN